MKELEFITGVRETIGKASLQVSNYAHNLRESLRSIKEPKRAILYPLIAGVTGGLGAWVMVEGSVLGAHLIISGVSLAVGGEQIPLDAQTYFNNPIRQWNLPTLPALTGSLMALYGGLMAFGEELSGDKPDYIALLKGRD